MTLPGNLTPGTYYLGAIADYNGQINESDNSNNASSAVAITATGMAQNLPDLETYLRNP